MNADRLQAIARTYREDADTFRREPELVDGTGGMTAFQWRQVYEAVAGELHKVADGLEEGT